MEYRLLQREEIQRLKGIDRSEIIEKLYFIKDGRLELKNEFYDVKNEGWIHEEVDKKLPRLMNLFDRGGAIIGAFDGSKLGGMVALESKWILESLLKLRVIICRTFMTMKLFIRITWNYGKRNRA